MTKEKTTMTYCEDVVGSFCVPIPPMTRKAQNIMAVATSISKFVASACLSLLAYHVGVSGMNGKPAKSISKRMISPLMESLYDGG